MPLTWLAASTTTRCLRLRDLNIMWVRSNVKVSGILGTLRLQYGPRFTTSSKLGAWAPSTPLAFSPCHDASLPNHAGELAV